jgi:hypothetical protein
MRTYIDSSNLTVDGVSWKSSDGLKLKGLEVEVR